MRGQGWVFDLVSQDQFGAGCPTRLGGVIVTVAVPLVATTVVGSPLLTQVGVAHPHGRRLAYRPVRRGRRSRPGPQRRPRTHHTRRSFPLTWDKPLVDTTGLTWYV